MMGEPSQRFTIDEYRSILDAARAGGYAFGRFTDPQPRGAVVYLRHDIDNCIESALLMAEVEARAEAVSTYLVMVRSENYNPFAGVNVGRLRRIRALGHEVGLHFSPAEHEPERLKASLDECIRADAQLLEAVVGEPVRVFSFHNPSEGEGFTVEVPGMVNAYSDRFYRHALYLSESNMRWSRGSPCEVLLGGEPPAVQILVHPLSYRDDFRSDRDVLLWFLRDTVRRLLELGVSHNRVLREDPISPAEVGAYLIEEAES